MNSQRISVTKEWTEHISEFTVMEIYVAYKDYNWMMSFTEQIIKSGTGSSRESKNYI